MVVDGRKQLRIRAMKIDVEMATENYVDINWNFALGYNISTKT